MNDQQKFAAALERSIRDTNQEHPTPVLTELLAEFDRRKELGERVEFRLNMETKAITLVQIEEVEASLSDMEEGDNPEDMIGPDGKPMVDFVYMDEDLEDPQTQAA